MAKFEKDFIDVEMKERKVFGKTESLPIMLAIQEEIKRNELSKVCEYVKNDFESLEFLNCQCSLHFNKWPVSNLITEVIEVAFNSCTDLRLTHLQMFTRRGLYFGFLLGLCAFYANNTEIFKRRVDDYSNKMTLSKGLLIDAMKDEEYWIKFSNIMFFYCMNCRNRAADKFSEIVVTSKDNRLYRAIKVNINSFDQALSFFYEDKPIHDGSLATHLQPRKSLCTNANEIFNKLKESVYGQDEALKNVSLMAMKHLLMINNPDVPQIKQNYMLLGPTGCGKTETTKALKKVLPVPVVTLNMSFLTPAGYRGSSCTDLLINELEPYANDPNLDYSVVILDEFDKMIQKSSRSDCNSDKYSKEGQSELLKLIEGCTAYSEQRERENDGIRVDTTNMLFILAGAFDGLMKKDIVIGETACKENKKGKNVYSDSEIRKALEEYGVIPELLGRIGNFTYLNSLTANDYVEIMEQIPHNMLETIKNQCKLMNVKFEYDSDAIEECANVSFEQKLGVRGMNNILQKAVSNSLFDASRGKCKCIKLTKNSVKEALI